MFRRGKGEGCVFYSPKARTCPQTLETHCLLNFDRYFDSLLISKDYAAFSLAFVEIDKKNIAEGGVMLNVSLPEGKLNNPFLS